MKQYIVNYLRDSEKPEWADYVERLEPPKGSTPASGSRTRVAAGDQAQSLVPTRLRRSRTKEGRALGQAITLLMEQAANDEHQADVYLESGQKKEWRQFYKLAAVNKRCADILLEMLSLTQSAADGDERCPRCDARSVFVTRDGRNECMACGHQWDTGSREERSASGNAALSRPESL